MTVADALTAAGIAPARHKAALTGKLTYVEGMALAKSLGVRAKDIVSVSS